MEVRCSRQLIMCAVGVGIIAVALAAGRLGLAGSPGLRIGQILLVLIGISCTVSAAITASAAARERALRLLRSQAVLIIGSTFLGLLLCEIASLAVEAIEQRGKLAQGEQTRNEVKHLLQPVADAKLELRLPAYAGGHDAKGFRNDRVPEKVSIVAIGDSQTWGVNASRSEAWPQVLSKLAGQTVYNMGLGSYGPVHYWVLTDEALELSPRTIVVGLFLGNDLWDAYRMVYSLGIYPQFRKPRVSPDLLIDNVAPRYHETVKQSENFKKDFQGKKEISTRWYDFLRSHSAFARVFYQRGIWPASGRHDYEDYELNRAWAMAYPDKGAVYEGGSVRTVFMTGQHLLGLDLDDPRIQEGLRLTKEMLLRIQKKTTGANAKLLVLFIPTKEVVYADLLQQRNVSMNATFGKVVAMESRARDEIILLCRGNGIQYVDPLPALRDAIQRDEQVYPWTGDSHFIPRGYAILAAEVNKSLLRPE